MIVLNINIMTGIILYCMTGGLLQEEYTSSFLLLGTNRGLMKPVACDLCFLPAPNGSRLKQVTPRLKQVDLV